MADKKNFRETVAEEMIRHLEAGTAPWQKPWVPGAYNASPFNPTTGKPYRGINSYWLELSGYSDPRWMTYKQASDFDAQVNKGEKSTQIEYWQWTKELPLLDQDGKPVRDAEGKAQKQSVRLERPKVFYANVFNGDQITGLEPYKAPELKFEPVVEAELILENSGVAIHHDQNDRAYYHRLTDDIHMPPAGAFKSGYEYYATALHEVGHATGAAHRMVRDKGPFGSELYAREELMVEMASYMMSRELGLGHYPDRHASYVDSWIKAIEADKNAIFQAAAVSEKIRDWVMQPELRPELEKQAQLAFDKRPRMEQERGIAIQGMELSPEEKQQRLVEAIELEEAKMQAFQPEFIGHERNSLRVHTPLLHEAIETAEYQRDSFTVGDEITLSYQTSSPTAAADLMKAVLGSSKGMANQETPSLATLELQNFIDLSDEPGQENPVKRLVGHIQENGEPVLIQIDISSENSELLERYSAEFRAELAEQIELSKTRLTNEIRQNLNLEPLYISSSRNMLDLVSNFHLPEAVKSQSPVYIQTASRSKKAQDQINALILASGRILDGSLPEDKLKGLSKLDIGLPVISFDDKDGLHKVSFNALLGDEKNGLIFDDARSRSEVTFSSRDEKKVQELAQTFMNATRLFKEQKHELENQNKRQYLVVPFNDIVKAKANGALFDFQARAWFAPAEADKAKLAEWMELPKEKSNALNSALDRVSTPGELNMQNDPVFLEVPFKDKNQVKELGGMWDQQEKKWFVPEGIEPAAFEKWLPENQLEAEKLFTLVQHVPEELADQTKVTEITDTLESITEHFHGFSFKRVDEKGQVIDNDIDLIMQDLQNGSNVIIRQKYQINDEIKELDSELSLSPKREKSITQSKEKSEKIYLVVPYSERNEAKAQGAKWDRKEKLWYAPDAQKAEALAKWSAKEPIAKATDLNPLEEFSLFLKDNGIEVKGTPIMDGKWHRASLEGEPKKQNASYLGYLDGRANGLIQNFKTDEKTKWVAVGQAMTEQERDVMKAKAAETKALREKDLAESQDKAAKKAFAIWKNTRGWADENNAEYLKTKGVKGYGIKVNQRGDLVIPLRDMDNRIHSLQTITPEGKFFTENSRKSGLMHVVDPMKDLEITDRIFIAESYGTGTSVFEMTRKPTVVAFDSGNLKAVAEEVRKKHPKAEIIIAADNDHHLTQKPPYQNVGQVKAQEAALAVGGKVAIPDFTEEEMAKGLTDWNDLEQSRGRKETQAQLVDKVLRPEKYKPAELDNQKVVDLSLEKEQQPAKSPTPKRTKAKSAGMSM